METIDQLRKELEDGEDKLTEMAINLRASEEQKGKYYQVKTFLGNEFRKVKESVESYESRCFVLDVHNSTLIKQRDEHVHLIFTRDELIKK